MLCPLACVNVTRADGSSLTQAVGVFASVCMLYVGLWARVPQTHGRQYHFFPGYFSGYKHICVRNAFLEKRLSVRGKIGLPQ